MTRNRDELAQQSLAAAIEAVADGREQALQEVYARTSAKLFGICLRILQDRGEAEDALQEVYLSVWRRATTFDPARASPITWLATLARSRALDRLRASGRPRPAVPLNEALTVPDQGDDALALLAARQERGRLNGCIDELEARQSGAIRAAFFDGFTYAELATRASVPLPTMKSWVRRGLIRLRECLER